MSQERRYSFEFFPTKTEAGHEKLMNVARQLASYNPDFFSCTYGAGGSTRDRTLGTVKDVLALAGLYLLRGAAILLYWLAPKDTLTTALFAIVMGLAWLGTVPLTNGTVASVFGVGDFALLGGIGLARGVGALACGAALRRIATGVAAVEPACGRVGFGTRPW